MVRRLLDWLRTEEGRKEAREIVVFIVAVLALTRDLTADGWTGDEPSAPPPAPAPAPVIEQTIVVLPPPRDDIERSVDERVRELLEQRDPDKEPGGSDGDRRG